VLRGARKGTLLVKVQVMLPLKDVLIFGLMDQPSLIRILHIILIPMECGGGVVVEEFLVHGGLEDVRVCGGFGFLLVVMAGLSAIKFFDQLVLDAHSLSLLLYLFKFLVGLFLLELIVSVLFHDHSHVRDGRDAQRILLEPRLLQDSLVPVQVQVDVENAMLGLHILGSYLALGVSHLLRNHILLDLLDSIVESVSFPFVGLAA